MLRLLLVLTALLGCAPNRLEAQQTENENLRARLEQPLVAPKPLLFWVKRLSHHDAAVRRQAIEFLGYEVERAGLFDPMFDEDSVERRSAFRSQARNFFCKETYSSIFRNALLKSISSQAMKDGLLDDDS
ncbi:MAG TPA: hypothetical protein VMM56_06325, partial [Planctomycetaceae bacterium]|nr:hypothetical protein [Planctomycetaceae bacterium]